MLSKVERKGKVTTTASANIFANRELEAISKGLSIRRLTFTLWCGERNKYLTQLPNIQEKLVDVLRANVGEVVHREVRSSFQTQADGFYCAN